MLKNLLACLGLMTVLVLPSISWGETEKEAVMTFTSYCMAPIAEAIKQIQSLKVNTVATGTSELYEGTKSFIFANKGGTYITAVVVDEYLCILDGGEQLTPDHKK